MTDLITRARRAAGIAGNDVTGNLLIELVDTIEQQAARVAELERELSPGWCKAEARVDEAERDMLAARLDRIEKWLKATHGYPYPAKG